jgi:hypothetical protein
MLAVSVGASMGVAQLTPDLPRIDGGAETETNSAVHAAQPRDAAWLEKVVADLDSSDFATRERASEKLSGDEGVGLSLIERRLTDASHPLMPEQVLRLSEAGLRQFTSTQRGAMGVQFALMDSAVDGVKVGATVDGFDSKRALKAGDVIREMDGVSLVMNDQMRSRNAIVAMIISHDPGDEVTLSVLRAGEPVVVRLKLGNYRDLRNANELDTQRMRTAWEMRCRRAMGGPSGDVSDAAEAGLSAQRWNQISDPVRRNAARRLAEIRQANPFLPQSGPEPLPEEAGTTLVAGGADRTLQVEPSNDFSAGEKSQRNAGQVRQIQMQIDQFTNLIRNYEKRLKDPNLPENQKRMLQATLSSYKQQLAMLKMQKKQLVGLEP